MLISDETLTAFREHVLQEYPKEAVGVLVQGAYVPCQNLSPDPDSFRISAKELASIGPYEACLHSHPYHPESRPVYPPEWPSFRDMQEYLKGKTPWGIVSTDGKGISPVLWLDDGIRPPLVGREFVYGVQDCYSVIRDYYLEVLDINLPNFPREANWENLGKNLYLDGFSKAGFRVIPKREARVHDVILYQTMSPVINHGAVLTGPDTILQHLWKRKSSYDSRKKWSSFEKLHLRHEKCLEM